DLASQLIELNEFQLEGLESVAADMAEVFLYTFKRSLGDKQHRFRGMAASYLGVVQHRESIPLLIKALEDDHAYVRGCAALALGRMRATEAKTKLEYTMKEDWDQTVRSRSREAVERMS
ncbi:MAG: HEAT repeat domain-containing protein, partial [Nitrospira sp.]|nr:HEAT repeat domain-containing protein [Nitrospira sp.]